MGAARKIIPFQPRKKDALLLSKRTCNKCLLYDNTTQACGIFDGVDTTQAKTAINCNSFFNEDETIDSSDYLAMTDELTLHDFEYTILGDTEEEDEKVTPQFLFELRGYQAPEDSKYPLQPDIPQPRNDAMWYVSPDQTFGCWIINQYTKKFMIADVQPAIISRVYKSLIPLHDHEAKESLQSQMAWYVNEDGIGQYVLLNQKGKIVYLSERKHYKE